MGNVVYPGFNIVNDAYLIILIQELIWQYLHEENCVLFASGNTESSRIVERALVQSGIPKIEVTENWHNQFEFDTCRALVLSTANESARSYFGQNKQMLFYEGSQELHLRLQENLLVLRLKHDKTSGGSFKLTLYFKTKRINLENISQIQELNFKNEFSKPKLNRNLSISYFHCSPHVLAREETGVYDGITYRMINEIIKDIPTEYVFIRNITSGTSLYDTSIDNIISGKNDLSACAFFYVYVTNESFSQGLSFTRPVDRTCLTLLVPKPQPLPDASYVFQPMQLSLWIAIITAITVGSKLLQLVSKLSFQDQTQNVIIYYDYSESVLQTVQLFTFGATKRFSAKQLAACFVTVSFSLTFLVLSTAYAAGFSSILTYPRFSKHIRTIQDLIDSNYKVVCRAGYENTYRNLLKYSANKELNILSRNVVDKNDGLADYARIVTIVGKKFAIHTENFTDYDKTKLRAIKDCVYSLDRVFTLQANSSLLDYFDRRILDLQEHGFDQHYLEMIASKALNKMIMYPAKNVYRTYIDSDEEHKPLSWDKTQAAFWLLMTGYVLSFAVFLLELHYGKNEIIFIM